MLDKISILLEKYDKDVWVMYNNEGSDKYFKQFLYPSLDSQTIAFVSKNIIYLFVSSLDADNIEFLNVNEKEVQVNIFHSSEELLCQIEEVIAILKFPNKVALSYSTMGDNMLDILTYGNYKRITSLIKSPYKKYSKKVSFSSAEKIIYELTSQRTERQIDRLKELASLTDEVLKEAFDSLKIGQTEKEMVRLVQTILKKQMKQVMKSTKTDIVDFDVAWENCPIVLTGENLAKGGHTLPSDKKLKRGDTIYFDFGIKAIYCDDEILYTDMQRMGYALKKGESEAPKIISKVFDVLVRSIEDGMEEMRPNVKAHTIDSIVRKEILKNSYPDYNHATGHPVGVEVHDKGAVITFKTCKLANLPLVEDGIYTLEPRVNIANGGSIEEMVLVTKFGGVPLCPPQKQLYYVIEK